jgi:zinc/manganese transport system substrate-binding protein
MVNRCRSGVYRSLAVLAVVVSLSALGGWTTGSAASAPRAARSGALQVAVAENFWGSIARQEGGNRAHVTSIIVSPHADPHAYEPSIADARLLASAQYVVYNGAGYDPWVPRMLDANPVNGRRVLEVGLLIGKTEGDNPHMWYSPGYVARVAAQITSDYKRLDPHDAAYFDRQHAYFTNVGLKPYHQEIALIARKFHSVKVGATESIFQYLAQALHLNLITPYGFMKALSEGTEPTAQDKATFDRQITRKEMKVFVLNSQNSTPDTNALETKARAEGIPVVPITETLQPAAASFQTWQTSQLRALAAALHRATGR